MSSNFPTSLDNSTSLPYPAALSKRNAPSLASLSDNQNDAVIATQTKLGIGASTPSGTNLLVSTGTGTSAWTKVAPTGTIVGTTDSQTLTNKILTSPTINSPVITNASITTDLITGFTVPTSGTIYGVPISLGVITTANTVNGASLVAASVGSTALATNAVQASQLATNAIRQGLLSLTTLNFSTASVTVVQITGMTLTATNPAGGRSVKVTVYIPLVGNSNGTVTTSVISLWIGTVGSGTELAYAQYNSSGNAGGPVVLTAVHTPASGSITYNVGMKVGAGTGFAISNGDTTSSGALVLMEAI